MPFSPTTFGRKTGCPEPVSSFVSDTWQALKAGLCGTETSRTPQSPAIFFGIRSVHGSKESRLAVQAESIPPETILAQAGCGKRDEGGNGTHPKKTSQLTGRTAVDKCP